MQGYFFPRKKFGSESFCRSAYSVIIPLSDQTFNRQDPFYTKKTVISKPKDKYFVNLTGFLPLLDPQSKGSLP